MTPQNVTPTSVGSDVTTAGAPEGEAGAPARQPKYRRGMTRAERADWAAGRAIDLAMTVREEGRDGITAWLAAHDRQAIDAIAVALAAMVPANRTVRELLAWTEPFEEEAA